jgi:hypothetical protein
MESGVNSVDRLISSLIASDTPLERRALMEYATSISPSVAPLAGDDAVTDAVDAIVGLGPLDPLLGDPDISDVLVNGPDDVWVERHGTLERCDSGTVRASPHLREGSSHRLDSVSTGPCQPSTLACRMEHGSMP